MVVVHIHIVVILIIIVMSSDVHCYYKNVNLLVMIFVVIPLMNHLDVNDS